MYRLETENCMLKKFKNLTIDKILFEAKSPILFTAINSKNEPYLFLCVHSDGENVVWLATKTSYQILIQLLENKLTITDSFLLGDVLKYIISLTKTKLTTQTFSRHNFPEEYLPTQNEYLDSDVDEFSEEIALFEERMLKEQNYA